MKGFWETWLWWQRLFEMSKSLSILIQHVNKSIKLATFRVKNALQNKFVNLKAFNQFVLYFKIRIVEMFTYIVKFLQTLTKFVMSKFYTKKISQTKIYPMNSAQKNHIEHLLFIWYFNCLQDTPTWPTLVNITFANARIGLLRLQSFGPLWTISTGNQWEISEVCHLSCFIDFFCLISHWELCSCETHRKSQPSAITHILLISPSNAGAHPLISTKGHQSLSFQGFHSIFLSKGTRDWKPKHTWNQKDTK